MSTCYEIEKQKDLDYVGIGKTKEKNIVLKFDEAYQKRDLTIDIHTNYLDSLKIICNSSIKKIKLSTSQDTFIKNLAVRFDYSYFENIKI